MSLEVTGKIVQKLEPQSGVSAKGEWKKQDFILETTEQYPRQVCITMWGDKINEIAGIQAGETITVSIEIESREFNGRWYTSVRGWKLQRGSGTQNPATAPAPAGESSPIAAPVTQSAAGDYANTAVDDPSDDLPF
jgi:hypothetical protein